MQKLSKRLENEILKVLILREFTTYRPKLVFHNPDTGYKQTVTLLNAFDIEQDFMESYMTKYVINVSITYGQYLLFQRNLQGLECTIILYPYSIKMGRDIFEVEPIIIKTKAMMDRVDLSKLVNNKTLGDDNPMVSPDKVDTPMQASMMMKVPIYLVDPGVYDTRHTQINAVLHDVTIEDVIHWAAYQFGFEKVNIVKPNNTLRYGNLVIPPMKNIANLFPYLQQTFGIYTNGLGYFVMSDELYMYPQFDKDLNNTYTDKFIHVINAPKGSYNGMDSYSRVIDGDPWIVSTSDANIEDASTKGIENEGNVHVSTNTDNNRDCGVVVNKDGSVVRNADNITVVQNANNNAVQSKSQVLKYVGQRTNLYTSTTSIAAYNSVYMSTGWVHARPLSLLPGQCLLYHYDDKNEDYSVKKGRILGVVYHSMLHPCNTGEDVLLTFNSVIRACLEPDIQQDTTLV